MNIEAGVFPNPFGPLLGVGVASLRPASLQRQRLRRAEMLAATRRLLAEGPEAFTLKRVSDECGVTVQTIRNSFGRREECLASALNEHTSAVWEALGAHSSGPQVFLDLAQIYYHCAVATPRFLRGMLTTAISNDAPLATLQRHGVQLKVAHLAELLRQRQLRPGVDVEALAAQITRLNTFSMYEWTIHGNAAELKAQMLNGNRLLLLGAMRAEAAGLFENWKPMGRA